MILCHGFKPKRLEGSFGEVSTRPKPCWWLQLMSFARLTDWLEKTQMEKRWWHWFSNGFHIKRTIFWFPNFLFSYKDQPYGFQSPRFWQQDIPGGGHQQLHPLKLRPENGDSDIGNHHFQGVKDGSPMEIFGNHDVQLSLGGVICSRVSAYLFGATILIQRNQMSTSWGIWCLFHDLHTMSWARCFFAGLFCCVVINFLWKWIEMGALVGCNLVCPLLSLQPFHGFFVGQGGILSPRNIYILHPKKILGVMWCPNWTGIPPRLPDT